MHGKRQRTKGITIASRLCATDVSIQHFYLERASLLCDVDHRAAADALEFKLHRGIRNIFLNFQKRLPRPS